WPLTHRLGESTATVYALDPKQPRTLLVYHAGKQLAAAVTVRGDEKQPVEARLSPLGKVTGRLLDADGEPLVGATVSVSAWSEIGRELYRFANPGGKPVVTDKEGRFALPGVVPGMKFYVQVRKGEAFYAGKPKIGVRQVKAGETLDLGKRTLEQ